MNKHTQQTSQRISSRNLINAILLIGAISLTLLAAKDSIPGDALYPVKTATEQTNLTLARNAGDRAEMEIAFAERRLQELDMLVKGDRVSEVNEVVISFETEINKAIMELEIISDTDPGRAAQIALEINTAMARYARILTDLAASAPMSIKPEVIRALDTARIVGSMDRQDAESKNPENAESNSDDFSNNAGGDESGPEIDASGNEDNDGGNNNANSAGSGSSTQDNNNTNPDDSNSTGNEGHSNSKDKQND
jgi:hypothetical protein